MNDLYPDLFFTSMLHVEPAGVRVRHGVAAHRDVPPVRRRRVVRRARAHDLQLRRVVLEDVPRRVPRRRTRLQATRRAGPRTGARGGGQRGRRGGRRGRGRRRRDPHEHLLARMSMS